MNTPSARLASIVFPGILGLGAFTFVVDMLLLVQPLYMLQVYDRVLTSGSIETLAFISLIAIAALILLAVADTVRAMMAGRIAAKLEVEIGPDMLMASMAGPRASLGDVQPIRDLGIVRGFIAGRGVFAFLDLPFAPVFIGVLYFVHPNLFLLTLGGAILLAVVALTNHRATVKAAGQAAETTLAATLAAQSFARNSESLRAMGMTGNVIRSWGMQAANSLIAQERMNRVNSVFAGFSRFLRLGLQIAILGYGAYLVVAGQMTAGMIFAASLISGRALQPIDQVIGGWKGFTDARRAWSRLKAGLDTHAVARPATDLPAPVGRLEVEQLVVFAPNAPGAEPLLKRISARFEPGDCVAVIGPSGAGKTTLVRTLIGAIEPRSGAVRIDGGDLRNWDGEKLGRFVGYLAQDVELLPGTIAENIARFTPEEAGAAVIVAAQRAQVHELIQKLPKGYNTPIGPGGLQLSGGQRQRIGLARAFFGSPRILVLDEPNASLDGDGDLALERALTDAKKDRVTVVIVTQRLSIATKADSILILEDGAIEDYGPRLEVIARQNQRIQETKASMKAATQRLEPVVTGRFMPVTSAGTKAAS